MARIIFKSNEAATVFLSMAEGMEDVQADIDPPRAEALKRLMEAVGNAQVEGETIAQIEDRDAEEAQAVIENCLDNFDAGSDPEDCMFHGDAEVVLGEPGRIDPPPAPVEMDLRRAVRLAIVALSQASAGTEQAAAHDWLVELYQQRGCEHLGEDEDGLLENCAIFIRG